MRIKELVQFIIGTEKAVLEDADYEPKTNKLVLSILNSLWVSKTAQPAQHDYADMFLSETKVPSR